ncbi:MAG: hypothetical protein QW404_00360 [Candidatus Nanoarchaeia archaeon]
MKKDSLVIETKDREFLFTLGYTHPPDSYNCYLQYVPFQEGDDPAFKKKIGELDYFKLTHILHYYSPKEYFERAAKSKSIKYLSTDYLLGKVFKVNQEDVKRVIDPREVMKRLNKKTETLVEKIAKILKVKKEDMGIMGSSLYGGRTEISDMDIVIYGRNKCTKAAKIIKQLTKKKEHQVIKYGRVHHRLFHIEGNIIDPHFILNDDENSMMEDYNFVFKGNKMLHGTIKENIESCFTPAVYKTEKGYFVTYTIGHRLLLDEGIEIELPTKLFEGTHKVSGIKNNFYIYRVEDGWRDPTKRKLFSKRVYSIPKVMKNAA